MNATFKDNALLIERFTATDDNHGKIQGHGKVELSLEKKFPFVLSVNTEQLEIVKSDLATISATGKASLFGTIEAAKIEGKIVADHAQLNLTSDFSSDYQPLNFTFVNHEEALAFSSVNKPFVLLFDLDVTLPENKGKVSGRGLDSYWKGHLKVLGSTDGPLVYGDISATKGTFTFANKKFDLTQGTLNCAGDVFSESHLNGCASYDMGEIRAFLMLRGSLNKPRISFESSPQLTQKEVLSWILFNKPLAEISPLEGLQLATIAMNVKSKGGSMNAFERLKRTLGVDQIDISRAESKNPEEMNDSVYVQVGKYISKDVLMKLSKDVANAVNRVAVEAKLHKNISLQAEVGDDQEGQMSLMWKHDY
ncbi:MAG: hypothetical protein JWO53_51 [Chlamydiia bacterium]|nr:hypothetical protein [Chlamydiia bacterium]